MHIRRVRSVALVAGAVLSSIAGVVPAMSAEYRGTQEQQQACTPDVMRLCADSVPDVNRIVSCLRRNRSNLSAPCGAVFGAGGAHRPKKG
jgi:Cysteine rich repeat